MHQERIHMYIFEITTPGTSLDYEDRDWTWKIEGLLKHLESQFYEANLALNMFLKSPTANKHSHSRQEWEKDTQRRSEIKQEVEVRYGGGFNHENWEAIHFETEIIFKREKWQQGHLPREFEHNQPFIYARVFLYALDAFDKFLKVLSQEAGVPENISNLYTELGQMFHDLRKVRNTAQHLEDRARGLGAGRNPQSLDLKPIENQMIKAQNGGVLVLSSLNGTKYGSTMDNGHYGEVDVSPESMEKLQQILQKTLDSFRWRGPKSHSPSI